ncbi:hypothetical protein KOR42_35340 [Thalassoglobus neptunius]|uniref:Restriction endonuclease type IV Mrr domain-containing protein n=1 Tax=Thalassoglobus neptunius TaxID=1938619 RepID=A0A5C5WLI1_9PLAN|nr:restriction endonuclease [Thalassoglobus neptunius]TWT51646.1 hypothetical protein KOR42_35340 [Thalassoglobus neptunius]
MNVTFHYPPDLMSLLVDTIPLLCRSKEDTLLFIKGAGVADSLTSDLWNKVRTDRRNINKYEIVRTVLCRLNEQEELLLRPRREILKRVVEFDDFSTCWPDDRLKAQGLVAQVQKLVNVKDSFTRLKDEHERERQKNISRNEAASQQLQNRRSVIEKLKSEFFGLFSLENPQLRGKRLEDVLNRLFEFYGICVREAFTVTGDSSEGILEQIDGVIELDGHLHFVEMKWWNKPVGVSEISEHMMRVFFRAEARAIIISASEFTKPAVRSCKEALSQKVVTLCTLQEFVMVLENQTDLADFLRRKVQTTIMEKNPFPQL